jgi:NADPH2:quinone reductase
MALVTAACGLFYVLRLPTPWQRESRTPNPVIIYGASSAVAAFAIKLAAAANIHPIIAVGSSTSDFVKPHLHPSKGDVLLDHRAYPDAESLARAIKDSARAAGVVDGRVPLAFDTISLPGTFDAVVSKAMAGPPIAGIGRPKIAVTQPFIDFSTADESVDTEPFNCELSFKGNEDGIRMAAALFRMATTGLSSGWLAPHPFEVVPAGLQGLEDALNRSFQGKIQAQKLVIRIANTPGLV